MHLHQRRSRPVRRPQRLRAGRRFAGSARSGPTARDPRRVPTTRPSTVCSRGTARSRPTPKSSSQVTGRGGVPDDASAVALNVGAVRPAEQGFLTIYPCGEDRPLASSVNYGPGTTVSNAANALIGEDGKVCIYSSKTVNVIVDVERLDPAGRCPRPAHPGPTARDPNRSERQDHRRPVRGRRIGSAPTPRSSSR